EDPAVLAERLSEEALGSFETLVPETEGEGEIPDPVERRAIAKAAFMRLHVDELEEQTAQDGIRQLPTKDAMAAALAEKYADELDTAAEIVLRREQGDPEYGLVTRIVPLEEAPDLDAVATAFGELEGRYFEVRTASFYLFGRVEHT